MKNIIDALVDEVADEMPGVCQLEYESGKSGVEFTDEALHRFVELIIQECSKIAFDCYIYHEPLSKVPAHIMNFERLTDENMI